MSIRLKIIIGMLSLILISNITSNTTLAIIASNKASEALSAQVQSRLVGLRDAKKDQIERYLKFTQNQVSTLSTSLMTIDALKAFSSAFNAHNPEEPDSDAESINRGLLDFYEQEFGNKYEMLNPGQSSNNQALLGQLNQTTRGMQFDYIIANPHPLGEKNKLVSRNAESAYNQVHSQHHPVFNYYLDKFGYYDIFLVDPQGYIVYSVFKELDFATSLVDGPYADSGIGEAYRRALGVGKSEVVVTDFEPYLPSYEAPASFLASPVYDADTLVGVLIFQAPVDEINRIMTYENNWKQAGLGLTGETYLVGADSLMRSQSRFLTEDESGYLEMVATQGVDQTILRNIKSKGSTLGIAPVASVAVDYALQGKSGIERITSYRGVNTVSAYAPVAFGGENWGILSEIEVDEAYGMVDEMSAMLWQNTLMILICVLVISALVSRWMGTAISIPVVKLKDFMQRASADLDLTERLEFRQGKFAKDETYEAGLALNNMMSAFHTTMGDTQKSSNSVFSSVAALKKLLRNLSDDSNRLTTMSDQLATAVEQMSAAAASVSDSAGESRAASVEAVASATEGEKKINENYRVAQGLKSIISVTADNVTEVAQQTGSIASMLDIIRGVADQTNLLALNAAIEAARAGEQGRGFAVVADEVRTLAQKTQDSTDEIQTLIENLQQGSENSVRSMTEAAAMVDETLLTAETVVASFKEINLKIAEIKEDNNIVSESANEQSTVSSDMATQVIAVADIAGSADDHVRVTEENSDSLLAEAEQLFGLVSRFKI